MYGSFSTEARLPASLHMSLSGDYNPVGTKYSVESIKIGNVGSVGTVSHNPEMLISSSAYVLSATALSGGIIY